MRLVAAALALALIAPLSGAAAMQGPVSTPPLAPGEVLLQLNGTGSVTRRADVVIFSVSVAASGATEAEARRDAGARIVRIVAALRGAGVPAAEILADEVRVTREPSMESMLADVSENSAMVDTNAMEADLPMGPVPPQHHAYAGVSVRLRDVGRYPALIPIVENAGGTVAPSPQYALDDQSGPRREARVQALASARAEADAYAAALGLRVSRVVRVTERLGMDLLSVMMNDRAMRRRAEEEDRQGPDITTTMIVGVDYALAPR